MSIKLIAVDMDGTFLNDEMKYNKERFMKQFRELNARGIKFVVASGNQYYQLKSFFPSIENEIAFVAENGAYVVDSGKELFSGEMSKETIKKVTDILEQYEYKNLIVCGRKSAYIHEDVGEEEYKQARKYYHMLQKVPHFENLNDKIFKFSTSFSADHVSELLRNLKKAIGSLVTPVSSGHGDIDFIIPGLHKASGIKLLQERWGINDAESIAFGDSGNDLEMISAVKYGFAMANAQKMVKDAASYSTQSNNEEGVLHTIDSILKHEWPFIE
ncbi:Cof-type HAD-IIB family hydrolase [Bacillus glycinifermentans]|uniref:Cof-type HAD-IIB family hydrolase n=1 Tax=Bacillus glycinifermentans TaxID=1664069 RepID=A0A0T6BUI4_9BACI|nr:Cof-type HAD-IIB family hydrolase [Bacillus glycinifermentans]ATH92520.1 HAD family hydrolase [Bacillus glycinifermentans]KRT95267.1 sugar phosphatase [Bacillus glycinifermentans]MEC0485071.1 Cof-type HAD-IIB family hydrolase [Bacillus glycinifermentans]